jgi:hypothetical protein
MLLYEWVGCAGCCTTALSPQCAPNRARADPLPLLDLTRVRHHIYPALWQTPMLPAGRLVSAL